MGLYCNACIFRDPRDISYRAKIHTHTHQHTHTHAHTDIQGLSGDDLGGCFFQEEKLRKVIPLK